VANEVHKSASCSRSLTYSLHKRSLLFKDHFDRTPEPLLKLAVFCTGSAIRHHKLNLLSEVAGTLVLVLVVLYNGQAGAELTAAHAGGHRAGRAARLCYRPGAGRHHWLRHQPRPRPHTASDVRVATHPGQRGQRVVLRLGAGAGPAVRGGAGGQAV
jgi:hypothetical protein